MAWPGPATRPEAAGGPASGHHREPPSGTCPEHLVESLSVETITCSCGAKVTRPIGVSSLCLCGREVAATKPVPKHSGEEAVRKGLDVARAQSHGSRPLIPLKDELPAEKR